MTTKTRRAFTDEFKAETVTLLESSGRPLTQIAAELGIEPSVLRNWRRKLAAWRGPGHGRCWHDRDVRADSRPGRGAPPSPRTRACADGAGHFKKPVAGRRASLLWR